jgi:hypothetical protein
MRLVLEQQTWPELAPDAAATAEQPHIVLIPPAPWQEDLVARRLEVLSWNLPPGTTTKVLYEELIKSSVDWPMRMIEQHVARGDEVVEVRLYAFYVLLEFWAGVIWRGPLATFSPRRAEIVAAVSGGRPDWRRREIIALHQLYESP